MTTDELLLKGVERKVENGTVVFSVDSLAKHYDGIEYHEVDVIDGYIKASDIFGEITEKEVEEVSDNEPKVAPKKKPTKPKKK